MVVVGLMSVSVVGFFLVLLDLMSAGVVGFVTNVVVVGGGGGLPSWW